MSTLQSKNYFLTYDRLLFGGAAAWNLIGAGVLLINPQLQLVRMGISDPQAKWLARSLASSAAAWGIGYLLIAFDSRRFREFIWLGVISKTLFGLISLWGVIDGAITGVAVLPGAVDLVLAGLFAERLGREKRE